MPRFKTPTKSGRSAPPERVLLAQKLLSEGRYASARESIMEQFGISRCSATRALTEASRLMALEADEERPYRRARAIARLSLIMDKAEAKNDLRSAIAAQREITRITGIAAPEEIVITRKPEEAESYDDLSDEEVEIIAKMNRRRMEATTEH